MPSIRKLMLVVLLPLVLELMPGAAQAEKRIALVIGNAAYQAGALATPANDAGLIAQTLQAAGFDVVGARDLDQNSLRRAFRDFLEKATGAGTPGSGPMSGSKKAKRPLGSLAEWPLRRTAGVLRFRSSCARLGRPL